MVRVHQGGPHHSGVAQRKSAGLISRRSQDRDLPPELNHLARRISGGFAKPAVSGFDSWAGYQRRRSSIRMSDCLVSRGLRVQFLPPAPTDPLPEPELKGYRWTGVAGFQHPADPLATTRSASIYALSWSGPAAGQMLRTPLAPPSPGRLPRPLSSVEERRASIPYAGVRLAQRAPTTLPRETDSGRPPKATGPGSTPGRGSIKVAVVQQPGCLRAM